MAGNISSDYLFHFTKRFENLLSILKEGYLPNYCIENWLTLDENLPHIGIPMVCFCDIPESFITPHKNKYGPYGIAMEKAWGIEKGITPITYVYKNCFNYSALQSIWKIYKENEESIREKDSIGEEILMGMKTKTYKYGVAEEFQMAFNSLFFLFKPYTGNDFSGEDICFYDEREWRFYPFGVRPPFIPQQDYRKTDEGRLVVHPIVWETYVNNLKEHYLLEFPFSAVKKVYVQSEIEKQKIIDEINYKLLIEVPTVQECDATKA